MPRARNGARRALRERQVAERRLALFVERYTVAGLRAGDGRCRSLRQARRATR